MQKCETERVHCTYDQLALDSRPGKILVLNKSIDLITIEKEEFRFELGVLDPVELLIIDIIFASCMLFLCSTLNLYCMSNIDMT